MSYFYKVNLYEHKKSGELKVTLRVKLNILLTKRLWTKYLTQGDKVENKYPSEDSDKMEKNLVFIKQSVKHDYWP